MQEPTRKSILWGFVSLGSLFLCIPSLLLLDTLQSYWSLLRARPREVLRPQISYQLPHLDAPAGREEIHPIFEHFQYHAPHARSVLLGGDFNHWKAERIPLSKGSLGIWETTVPLPPGRYRYRFLVDGQWVLDPDNPDVDAKGPFPSSIRMVKTNP